MLYGVEISESKGGFLGRLVVKREGKNKRTVCLVKNKSTRLQALNSIDKFCAENNITLTVFTDLSVGGRPL